MSDRAPGQSSSGELAVRRAVGALGVLVMAVGVLSLVQDVPAQNRWPVLRWLVGGLVLHDAVLAPAAVLLGVLVLRRVPDRLGGLLRAGLLAAAALGFLLLMVVMGSMLRRNPTVLPVDQWISFLGATVLLALVCAGVGALGRAGRTRRRARGDDPVPGASSGGQ